MSSGVGTSHKEVHFSHSLVGQLRMSSSLYLRLSFLLTTLLLGCGNGASPLIWSDQDVWVQAWSVSNGSCSLTSTHLFCYYHHYCYSTLNFSLHVAVGLLVHRGACKKADPQGQCLTWFIWESCFHTGEACSALSKPTMKSDPAEGLRWVRLYERLLHNSNDSSVSFTHGWTFCLWVLVVPPEDFHLVS